MAHPSVPLRIDRRRFLGGAAIAALGARAAAAADAEPARPALKGRIKQAACRGAFGKKMTLEQMCAVCVEVGLHGIDFVAPAATRSTSRRSCTIRPSCGRSPTSASKAT